MRQPAFPVIPPLDAAGMSATGYPFADSGMTLRDYFAGEMLRGIAMDISVVDVSKVAAFAYKVADAMLAERNKEES